MSFTEEQYKLLLAERDALAEQNKVLREVTLNTLKPVTTRSIMAIENTKERQRAIMDNIHLFK